MNNDAALAPLSLLPETTFAIPSPVATIPRPTITAFLTEFYLSYHKDIIVEI